MDAGHKDRPPPSLHVHGNGNCEPKQPSVKFRKEQEQGGDPEKKPEPDSEEANGFWTAARRQYMVIVTEN